MVTKRLTPSCVIGVLVIACNCNVKDPGLSSACPAPQEPATPSVSGELLATRFETQNRFSSLFSRITLICFMRSNRDSDSRKAKHGEARNRTCTLQSKSDQESDIKGRNRLLATFKRDFLMVQARAAVHCNSTDLKPAFESAASERK